VLASGALTLSEPDSKPLAKAMAHATTLHVRPTVEIVGGSVPTLATVATKGGPGTFVRKVTVDSVNRIN
jgi:hypothetical protein